MQLLFFLWLTDWLYLFVFPFILSSPLASAAVAFQWQPGAKTAEVHRHAGNRPDPPIRIQYQVYISGNPLLSCYHLNSRFSQRLVSAAVFLLFLALCVSSFMRSIFIYMFILLLLFYLMQFALYCFTDWVKGSSKLFSLIGIKLSHCPF